MYLATVVAFVVQSENGEASGTDALDPELAKVLLGESTHLLPHTTVMQRVDGRQDPLVLTLHLFRRKK